MTFVKLKSDHECRRAYMDTSLNITFKVCSTAAAPRLSFLLISKLIQRQAKKKCL